MTGKDGKSHDGRTLLEETFNGILGIERNEAHQHETWTEEKDVELSLSLSLRAAPSAVPSGGDWQP